MAFNCKRGLRQGDPLSPLLFNLCIDVLFRLVDKAICTDNLTAVGIGEIRIHSLHFADDVLLFFDGSLRSAMILRRILDVFSANSGLKINFAKSSISPINIPRDQAAAVSAVFNCPLQDFPLMYLGLPLSPKALRRVDYLPLIEKIDKRLAGWKCSTLSRGGRLILLNSVLSSLPIYFCSAFALPVWTQRSIDRIRRSFFWKEKSSISGFHCLSKWDLVCRPKKVGGMGISNLQVLNSALLMKGLWKFFTSYFTPWVLLLKEKHYKRHPAASSIYPPHACCPIWRNLVRLITPFLISVDFIIGDGKDTPFWRARWSGDIILQNRFPSLFAAFANSKLSVYTWSLRFASQPTLGFNSLSDPRDLLELARLTALSSSIALSTNTRDPLSWRWTSSNQFSVKSASAFLLYDGVNSSSLPFLWKLKIPLRVKIFLWLAANNKILTADNLLKRGWQGPTMCALCNSDAESIQHIMLQCSYAAAVWSWLGCPIASLQAPASSLPLGLAAPWCRLRRQASGQNLTNLDLGIAATFWEIWKERNRRIFDNRQIESEILGRCISDSVMCWKSVLGSPVS